MSLLQAWSPVLSTHHPLRCLGILTFSSSVGCAVQFGWAFCNLDTWE